MRVTEKVMTKYRTQVTKNTSKYLKLLPAIDLVVTDYKMPKISGLDLVRQIRENHRDMEVIMITGYGTVESAVRAIKLGAYEYIIKPFLVDDVINIIHRALEKRNLMKQVTYLRNELERVRPFDEIIGEDDKMHRVFDLISSIADSDGAVLIQGESGTGKELVARAIHRLSPRKDQPFVVIACAAIPPTLVESELFGYQKGAFTGALRTTLGKLEIANKGTVLLDDIDTLDVNMQAKLLRVIQEKEFERLGTTRVIKLDVRFLASTNKDLTQLIQTGAFREDLFYRLNVLPLDLPPLRHRKKDIPLLIDHFLKINAKRSGKPAKTFSKEAIQALTEYDWPGNVRELQNLVERCFTISKDSVIQLQDISILSVARPKIKGLNLKDAVDAFEQEYIGEVLESVDGNRSQAALLLGVHRNTLLSKLGASTPKKDK